MKDIVGLHRLFVDVCFGESESAVLSGLVASPTHLSIREEDAAALLAAKGRLGLYRRLVRHNVIGVIDVMLEHSRARFEHHAPGIFERSLDEFLVQCGPRTPHLRDVPGEFLAWATTRWHADACVPEWLVDYARHELVEFTVGAAARFDPPPMLAEISADRPLVFATPHVLLRLRWAVHVMPAEEVASIPEARSVVLLVYRDAEHQVRRMDLSPLAAAILEHLWRGLSLGTAMVEACKATSEELNDAVLRGTATLLADLGERGLLLGATPTDGS